MNSLAQTVSSEHELLLLGNMYVVESCIKGRENSPLLRIFDLLLLTVFGGIERTVEEYASLFSKSGLQLKEEISTECGMSILVVGKRFLKQQRGL